MLKFDPFTKGIVNCVRRFAANTSGAVLVADPKPPLVISAVRVVLQLVKDARIMSGNRCLNARRATDIGPQTSFEAATVFRRPMLGASRLS